MTCFADLVSSCLKWLSGACRLREKSKGKYRHVNAVVRQTTIGDSLIVRTSSFGQHPGQRSTHIRTRNTAREEKSIRCLNCLQVVCLVVAEYVYRLKSSELTSARLTQWRCLFQSATRSFRPLRRAPVCRHWFLWSLLAITEIEAQANHFMTFLITYFP